ncbi:MAG: helix-turn-helix domain-containing protein [Oscillospiraceae bacterium]|nr:helix-turn-helix domain-containing protein [Oscillospiraceae bacterium]
MKLTMDVLADCLSGEYQIQRFGPQESSLRFSRPRIYECGSPLKMDMLYVARIESFPKKLPSSNSGIICIGARIPREWAAAGIPILQIVNAEHTMAVFNALHTIYDKFDQWEALLRDELERELDFDLRNILKIGTEMIHNPIGIVDHGLQEIFSTEIHVDADGMHEIKILDHPQPIFIEHREQVKNVCRLERIITVPYLTSIEVDGRRFYCCNLYPMGYFAGCISIAESHQSFRSGDFFLMDYFFAFFQKAFSKHLRIFGQTESLGLSALRNLLEHIPLSNAETEQLSLQEGECWACFKLKPCRNVKFMPQNYMYTTLSAMMPRLTYAVVYHDEIVGLLRLQAGDPKERSSTLSFFEDIVERMGYIGGVSNDFIDLNRISDYLLQASYCVENGSPEESTLYFFQNQILQFMLNSCTGELPKNALYPQGLTALLEYDHRKGTDHTKTLDTYLLNEMSISKTAEALFIHRSSLIKRLDKIMRLTGTDFSDPYVRLHYRICFALMEDSQNEKTP